MRSVSGRVAVVRAPEDAPALVARLRARGLDPVVVPAVSRVLDPAAIGAVLGRPHDVLLLTSRAAVRALAACAPASLPPRVACVGPASARAARDLLGVADPVLPDTATGQALIDALHLDARARVLWVRGAEVTPDTVTALDATGARVTHAIAYRMVATPDAAAAARHAAGPLDLAVLTSPALARAWSALDDTLPPALRQPRAVCIGPTTGRAAEAAGLDVRGVAQPHDLDTLADLAAAICKLLVEG